jgi:hypothetical protein
MATFRHLFAVLSLILAVGFVLHAQSAAQEGACSGENLLVAFSAGAQYDAACAAFTACMEVADDSDFVPCVPHFYAERAALCETDDQICVAQARLHTALIGLTVGNGYVDHGQPDAFWTNLADRIGHRTTLESVNIQDALAWYEPLSQVYNSEFSQHPMLLYSSSVLEVLKDDPESGFELIADSITEDSNNPLVYLTRGDLYATSGADERAALDYFLSAALTGAPGLNEALETMLTSRTGAYPFSYDAAVYALYPVLETYEGPGGRAIIDTALEEPIEIQLQQYGDLLLFIPDFDQEHEEDPYRVLLPLYPMEAGVGESYSWYGSDYDYDLGSFLTLQTIEAGFKVVREDYSFEANSAREFLLVPEGSEDPRPTGFRCEGAPVTRLEGATFATPLRWWEPVQLYDQPGGTATEIEQNSQMLIALTGTFECRDGFTWWPVTITIEEAEHAGWIQENETANSYRFERIDYD